MVRKGKIIVIDGADGTGKATTTQLVLMLLQQRKPLGQAKVLTESFPNYREFHGRQVRAYLSGDEAEAAVWVPPEIRADPYCASLPYAADRYRTYINRMQPQLSLGNWYLLDRYSSSNMAHMGAKLTSVPERNRFIKRLGYLENSYFQLPKPDLVLILNLPEEIRVRRTEKRRDSTRAPADDHEQNLSYMAKVAQEYRRLADKFGWTIVEGVEDGRELTKEEMADRIFQRVVCYLGL
ncbi:MAG: hypothetical protein AAB499_00310 [Patescibacteria group bacterium]